MKPLTVLLPELSPSQMKLLENAILKYVIGQASVLTNKEYDIADLIKLSHQEELRQ